MKLHEIDPGWKDYATPRQVQIIDSVLKNGWAGAQKELGLASPRNLYSSIERARDTAARQGYSPQHDMTKTVPEGYHVRGVSTYYDADGNVQSQWVKSHADYEKQLQMMREAVEAISETIPKAKKTPDIKKHLNDDLLNLYIITDYHLGMKSWHEETGDDWDLKIAEDLIYNWFEYAISVAPETEVGVLCQLGDFTHFDSLEAVTPTSRHQLDADSRAQKMARIAIRIYRRVIAFMLKKHKKVHVIIADANHDPMGSIWCREWVSAHYEDEPRVTVDLGADGYYCYEHGDVSLFFHHGHKRKPNNIDDVFAAKFRDVFGRTKYSFGHMGHLHHKELKETNLMVVEQHRTLAAKDAYAARGGYLAGRDAPVITYHKDYGQVAKLDISPEMVGG